MEGRISGERQPPDLQTRHTLPFRAAFRALSFLLIRKSIVLVVSDIARRMENKDSLVPRSGRKRDSWRRATDGKQRFSAFAAKSAPKPTLIAAKADRNRFRRPFPRVVQYPIALPGTPAGM